MDSTLVESLRALPMDRIEALKDEIRRCRAEAEECIAEAAKPAEAPVVKPSGDELSPEMRGFCRWVLEQYYLAMEDPEWVAAEKRYREVLDAEGEAAAEPYLPPFKVRHKKERTPAGTGAHESIPAEKSKVRNSAKKSIPQNNQKVK